MIILVIQASLISAHEEANLRNCRRSTNDFVVSLIMLFGRIFVKTLQMLMIILRSNLDSFVVWSQSQGHRHPPSWWPSPRPGFCTPRNLGTEKSIKQVILWRQIRTIVLASNQSQCSQLTMLSNFSQGSFIVRTSTTYYNAEMMLNQTFRLSFAPRLIIVLKIYLVI